MPLAKNRCLQRPIGVTGCQYTMPSPHTVKQVHIALHTLGENSPFRLMVCTSLLACLSTIIFYFTYYDYSLLLDSYLWLMLLASNCILFIHYALSNYSVWVFFEYSIPLHDFTSSKLCYSHTSTNIYLDMFHLRDHWNPRDNHIYSFQVYWNIVVIKNHNHEYLLHIHHHLKNSQNW